MFKYLKDIEKLSKLVKFVYRWTRSGLSLAIHYL